ncbi:hypothetical protein LCG56_05535 [Pseudomonas cannabina pv. alisalensis]|uniref:Uncharacterized protein n=2 Tax=Pseudomonas syringae group TaxID=136849 RepID=A0A8T8C2S7_PSEYM|nr:MULTISPECIES: hypothetical protein [Pseudomonas syringae group]MBM0137635.1 hypothetical protein [Pseudomonas cannabina pv. alisalensis]QHE97920.1 hypothetical protein PMA4326_015790 [Pseudomonas syringae pv. maculicola str. ES4326]UBY98590.1 hypothetical protein LCG56_05535 [Pseudomonas cannabina pv. alisalensis]
MCASKMIAEKSESFGKYRSASVMPCIYLFVMLLIVGDKYSSTLVPLTFEVSSGAYSTVRVGGDTFISLVGPDSKLLFTCSLGMIGYSGCLDDTKNDASVGMPTTIQWYKQSFFPNKKNNKIASITVNGEEVLTHEMTRQRSKRDLVSAVWLHSVGFIIVLFISLALNKLSRKNSDGSGNN